MNDTTNVEFNEKKLNHENENRICLHFCDKYIQTVQKYLKKKHLNISKRYLYGIHDFPNCFHFCVCFWC